MIPMNYDANWLWLTRFSVATWQNVQLFLNVLLKCEIV